MAFFLRSATIQVGPLKYDMNDGFYFEFEVPFYDSDQLVTATITINNLSATSRAGMQKNQVVILNAGYEDDMGVLFVGQVAAVSHKQNGVDWQTKITATAALDQWLKTQVNKTYMAGATAEDVVRDLLNIFGLEIGIFQLVENVIYPRGRICSGKLKDVLTEIVVNECKSRLLIRNNQVIINNPADGVTKGYLLTPDSGLLMSSEDSDTTATATQQTVGASTEVKKAEEKTWKRQCLLNYRLAPGDLIQIQSKDLNGKYIIVSGKHKGSPTGNWLTEIEFKIAG
ncbi:MAG: phage protein [Lacrimispora sphenoides]